ncbi:MAG: GspH/FimT family protein [Deltaproteobacteria bacterium]|nr:MAG: GspH/FimT family protein [Deltaproteobacteria bacterium]
MRNESAFTLAELIVAISIIAILASITIGGFILWLPKYKLNSAANELQATIQAARLQAVKENARVVILLDPNADGDLEGDYIAFVDDETGGGSEWTREPASEPLVKRGQLPEGVSFTNTTFANNRLRYNSRGLLDGINGSINLKNSRNATKRITVYVSGNSRVF